MPLLLAGAVSLLHARTAAAQAIGTMQVGAWVHRAPAAWPAVAATADLVAQATTLAPAARRRDLGLVRLELEDPAADPRRLRIRIDYLRN